MREEFPLRAIQEPLLVGAAAETQVYEPRAGGTSAAVWLILSWAVLFGLWQLYVGQTTTQSGRLARTPILRLKALHSGVVTDYVTWTTAGVAALGAAFVLALR